MSVDFGIAWSCITDVTPTFARVTGRRLLAEAVVRRITTRKGQLIDDPNYGIDVRDWLNEGMTPPHLARLAGTIDGELVKDERIIASKTRTAFDPRTSVLTVTTALEDGDGPFTLVAAISALSVQLLKVAA
jgi:hypothetical protein